MSSDDKILAESVRSGRYFEESRAWFEALYIGPISERTFFLIVATLAGFVAIFCLFALSSLMPITSRDPVLVYAHEREEQTIATLVRLKDSSEPVNPAMIEFFVEKYVEARESYMLATYMPHANFIRQQSTDTVYQAYLTQNDVANPASPAATLGELGKRFAVIRSVDVEKGKAVVKFTTWLEGVENENKTNWTAHIEFVYTNMDVTEVKNAETGERELQTTDPKFQVVKYEVEQK